MILGIRPAYLIDFATLSYGEVSSLANTLQEARVTLGTFGLFTEESRVAYLGAWRRYLYRPPPIAARSPRQSRRRQIRSTYNQLLLPKGVFLFDL